MEIICGWEVGGQAHKEIPQAPGEAGAGQGYPHILVLVQVALAICLHISLWMRLEDQVSL